MPALGMAQDSGVLMNWLKQEGERVAEGELLMEIETDKATAEIEAPASGILSGITAAPGDEVPVGQIMAWILAPGESAPETAEEAKVEQEKTVPASDGRIASPVAARIASEFHVDLNQVPSAGSRISKADVMAYVETRQKAAPAARLLPASPKARRLARERQINLAGIQGSGPEGAVLSADLAAAAPRQEPLVPAAAGQPASVSKTWRLMADRLTQSWTSVPHFYLVREVDATHFIQWQQRAQERAPEKLTVTDLLVKLTAAALRLHPRVNGSWQDGVISLNESIHIGLAVAIEEGLVVPVIHQADNLSLNQIAARRKEIVQRAQAGKLRLDDIQGGTFTLSNLGMFGVDAFNAIVNPPQAAILAVGRIAERVVPVDGQPAVRPMLTLTLSFDHRVVDGARGAKFLQTLANFIEDPLRLLD